MGQHAPDMNRSQELEDAFLSFNHVSEQLMSSYRLLEDHVASLTDELATAHSERQSELLQKERLADRLQTLLSALPAGVIVLDGEGRVQESNPAAEELLGEPLCGEIWRDIIARAFSPQANDGHEVSLKDGRLVSISTSPLGSEPGLILLLKDVTETRSMQEALNRNNKLTAMGQMAASLAHQIRTPLSSALLYASHLTNDNLSASKRKQFSGKIVARMRDLEQMVNDMLVFVRGKTLDTEKINICDLVSEIHQTVEIQAHELACEISVDCCIPESYVRGNKLSIQGALTNLVNNAIEAGTKGTHIRILVSMTSQEKVCIEVIDNGPGISREDQDRVFEPFFTKRASGTGLGLAVVQAVATAHDGQVWVKSQPGEGAIFGFEIPLCNTSHNENSTIASSK